MPTKTSKKKQVPALPSIPKELIDQMVSGPMDAEAVNAASMAFKKALIERILGAELSHHLGYPQLYGWNSDRILVGSLINTLTSWRLMADFINYDELPHHQTFMCGEQNPETISITSKILSSNASPTKSSLNSPKSEITSDDLTPCLL